MISFNFLIYWIPFLLLFSLTSSGFRSRVKFFSVLNPTSIVTYTSEVVDAGLLGPLFKVSHLLHFNDCMFQNCFHSWFVFLESQKLAFPLCAFPVFMLKCLELRRDKNFTWFFLTNTISFAASKKIEILVRIISYVFPSNQM